MNFGVVEKIGSDEFMTKHNLNFILLSDKLNELKNAFKDHNNNMPIQRTTFILDKEGNIIQTWNKVDIDNHINEITEYFEKVM